ncbi:MAG: hypothetical protein HN731_02570 [Rhodospirillaceae bacterium]|nr:hypothetical protein [Rhodospirillaceae bacterium]
MSATGLLADIRLARHSVCFTPKSGHSRAIHGAQFLSYLKLTRLKFGLILNFYSVLLKNGIRRFVL